jgi:aerobic carbon-monoxide dehydrogenase medium subunit
VIPAQFDYLAPSSVEEAVSALAEHGDEAKVLAGGQSLLPILRMRLNAPGLVIDLGRIAELQGITEDGDRLLIGAMTTYAAVLASEAVSSHAALLSKAIHTVADPQIRHRGTIGGALAHADPTGDLPAVALALDAELVIAGPEGRRHVPAAEFFSDYLETAIQPGELLVEIRVPVLGPQWGTAYEKFQRVAQAWAIVGVAALVRSDGDSIAEARIGLTNMGPTPLRASAAEQALAGVSAQNGGIAQAAERAADDTEPPADLSAQPDYRRHLARVLTRRAVRQAASASS